MIFLGNLLPGVLAGLLLAGVVVSRRYLGWLLGASVAYVAVLVL